jgi:hypothetical protein
MWQARFKSSAIQKPSSSGTIGAAVEVNRLLLGFITEK